jgi:arsenical pump membrane protein
MEVIEESGRKSPTGPGGVRQLLRTRPLRSAVRKLSVLDRIRIGLLAVGILCVLTRLLPRDQAVVNLERIKRHSGEHYGL